MHLTDTIAARRRHYSHRLATAPSILLIDIPKPLAGDGLALGRYYPVVAETPEEIAEFEEFLTADRPLPTPPNLLDRRPSARAFAAITFLEYAPPEPGWPWLLLCHWPREFVTHIRDDPELLARGAYTIETFTDHAALLTNTVAMMDMLRGIPMHAMLRAENPGRSSES